MGRVGPGPAQVLPADVGPRPIAPSGLGRGAELVDPHRLDPARAVRVAVVRDAGGRAHPGPGEDEPRPGGHQGDDPVEHGSRVRHRWRPRRRRAAPDGGALVLMGWRESGGEGGAVVPRWS
ncbi:hypothetical protein SDC9_121481 [bioreactor metagenome]|uniref:Uncharacterized protein n=1 Tax=bioreactor metagenome TaxID=1076179 RepID=A0A645CC45_9ZZZZ